MKVLLLTIFSLLVSIIGADLIARRFVRMRHEDEEITRSVNLKEHAPNMDRVIKPDAKILSESENLENKPYRLRTDEEGFLLGSHKSNGPIDIIFFGGSTTECMYVDEAFRFPYLVGEILGINTRNAGKSGNNSMHSLIQLIGKGIDKRPKIVVFMENVNDLALLSHTGSYWKAPHFRSIIQEQGNREFSPPHAFFKASKDLFMPHLWALYRSAMPNPFVAEIDEWKGFRKLQDSKNVDLNDIKRQYRSSLHSLIQVARAWGIEPVLMTQFNRFEWNDDFSRKVFEDKKSTPLSFDNFVRLYADFNAIATDVAKETKTHLIDLNSLVPKNKQYIYDFVHLNDEGSKLVAKEIAASLRFRFVAFRG